MSKVFNLSVVNIIPDAQKDAINQIAELYDCGENNLSVKLIDSNGAVYWGLSFLVEARRLCSIQ